MNVTEAKVLIIGFGSIGQAVVPLLVSHFGISKDKIIAIASDNEGKTVANEIGIKLKIEKLCPENLKVNILREVGRGDLVLNLSVNVSSVDIIKICQSYGIFYIDTCIEPWNGDYHLSGIKAESTNSFLRDLALSVNEKKTSAIIAHGANPGLVTHFVKVGLKNLADIKGIESSLPFNELALSLGVQVIQIAEKDSQEVNSKYETNNVFHNTWSCSGFKSELFQFAELGLGTHEVLVPENRYGKTTGFLNRFGIETKVKSWVPSTGEVESFLVSHHEATSISEFLSIYNEDGSKRYSPTVYFAYKPCPAAEISLENFRLNKVDLPKKSFVIKDEIDDGVDELGVLFLMKDGDSYWYGSELSIAEARKHSKYNNATSLQVVAGIIGSISWLESNPCKGIVEAELMDHEIVLSAALPYLGKVGGYLSEWKKGKELSLDNFLI